MHVNRRDLIQQLVDTYQYTKKAATSVVDDFCEIIRLNMREGNDVSIYGFGNFEVEERKRRVCPNPKTGEPIEIPAHYVPKLHPSKTMKLAVRMWEDDQKRGLG